MVDPKAISPEMEALMKEHMQKVAERCWNVVLERNSSDGLIRLVEQSTVRLSEDGKTV